MKPAALGVGDFPLSASSELREAARMEEAFLPAKIGLTERITVQVGVHPGVEHAPIFLFLGAMLSFSKLAKPIHRQAASQWPASSTGALFTGSWHTPNHQRTRPIPHMHVIARSCTNPSASNLFLVFA